MALKLHVITCSTRPGRVGPTLAKWFVDFAVQHGKFETASVDLAEIDLPVYDEPRHPALQRYEHAHTRNWAAIVDAADAYVFVTPEYNYGPPPALLNAMTYVYKEWNYKPAGFVSYGGVSGGMRAVEKEKLMFVTFKIVPIVEGVIAPRVEQSIDAQGRFAPSEVQTASAKIMLDELLRWAETLKTMRN